MARTLEGLDGIYLAAIGTGGGRVVYDPKRVTIEQLLDFFLIRGDLAYVVEITPATATPTEAAEKDCGPQDMFCEGQ